MRRRTVLTLTIHVTRHYKDDPSDITTLGVAYKKFSGGYYNKVKDLFFKIVGLGMLEVVDSAKEDEVIWKR